MSGTVRALKIHVTPGGQGGPHHLADATLELVGTGLTLVGFSLWKYKDGRPGTSVVLPGKPYKKGDKEDYFSYVRDTRRAGGAVKLLKAEIERAFTRQCPAQALRAKTDESGPGPAPPSEEAAVSE